jgi:HD-like signal output (HDOD) protein
MDKLAITDQIRRSKDLLSLPQAISELLTEMEKPEFSADSLSKIILKDPSLTSRILRIANSAFYHRFADIRSVQQAVVVLGMTTVKCLALSSSILNRERVEKSSGVDAKALFTNILTTAAAAEKIAQMAGFKATEEAFIGGLLHDIGIIFFLHRHPEKYRNIAKKNLTGNRLIDAERLVFSIDHAEVGHLLAQKWRLPENVTQAIRDHHDFINLKKTDTLSNIIRLATLLVDTASNSSATDLQDRLSRINRVSELLSITKEEVDEISGSLLAEAIKVAEYVGIDIGDIEEMLIRSNKELWRTYLMIENLFKERQELSSKLLREERSKGAIESKNIAIATLSHYINNAAMAIYGRIQLMQNLSKPDKAKKLIESLPDSLDVMERSLMKIVAVLAEIKEISPIDDVEFYNMSQAMNVGDRIEKRVEAMSEESGLVLPEEAMDVSS